MFRLNPSCIIAIMCISVVSMSACRKSNDKAPVDLALLESYRWELIQHTPAIDLPAPIGNLPASIDTFYYTFKGDSVIAEKYNPGSASVPPGFFSVIGSNKAGYRKVTDSNIVYLSFRSEFIIGTPVGSPGTIILKPYNFSNRKWTIVEIDHQFMKAELETFAGIKDRRTFTATPL